MQRKPEDQAESDQHKLHDLLDGTRTVMLTSVGADGSLFSRPMAMLDADSSDESELWFIADLTSDKAHEIASDRHVNLSFTHKDSRWVSIGGTASAVRDNRKLREVWNTFAEAWFPGGQENPNIGLIKVNIQQVDYWETSTPKPVALVKHTIAAMTGKRPDVGNSGTLRP
jgi:general stress protein 26